MRAFLFITILTFVSGGMVSQNPINAYANVTAISGTSLSVNNVNETYHSFEDGNYVIIMQMQDNVIGTNTTNASTFGDLGSIASAGLFEVVRISSHTESASLPNSITLSSPLVNSYSINSNASVQLITFRNLGTNFTTTANIAALAWNGTVGGVTAMSVSAVFTMAHNITANASGFRGGTENSPNGYTSCSSAVYISTLTTRYAAKGEGIYKVTNTSFAAARGKILNGGGGGNDVNAGGGGGGNYSAGGGGGVGWTSSGTGCSPGVGGLGGISLSGSISGSRIFMGGGGGGGHENDNNGTQGAAGGGIVIIKTGTLATSGCSGASISANGGAANNATNDGAGGGGAGGTVFIHATTYSISGACQLTVSANGGNGGNSNASGGGAHGGGGGGGQGSIIYALNQPTANVTNNTSPGTGGVSCSGCSSSQNGSVATGTNNSGSLISGAPGPLPVELLNFEAKALAHGNVLLSWKTAKEVNSKSFVVQRLNGKGLSDIATVSSKGDYSSYSFLDQRTGEGDIYYRLLQEDRDGKSEAFDWVSVHVEKENKILIYPNPLAEYDRLVVIIQENSPAQVEVEIINTTGHIQYKADHVLKDDGCEIDLSSLTTGVYVLKISWAGRMYYEKLIKVE